MTVKESWPGRFFEDFAVGDVYRHALGRTVTQADNVWFTLLTTNNNPIHFDAVYSAQTEFGFVYGGKRSTKDGQNYWRLTTHIQPWFTEIPGPTWEGSGNFVVPMDDENSWWFTISPPG